MISVIICHHKGRDLLIQSVESLLRSLEVEIEIIVATSDETLIDLAGARIIQIKGGPAHKRNVASRFASGKYLAFFDDDIEATPHALLNMQYDLTMNRAAMVFGKLLNMEHRTHFDEAGSYLTPTGFLWARAESGLEDKGQYQEVEPVLAGKSAACLICRKVFWEVGGFDASYEILGEETDLAWRVWLYGYKVLFSPLSVTYHAFNSKFKPADFYIPKRVYFNGCRNYIAMLLTNLGYPQVIFSVGIQVAVWTMAGLGMLFTGKFQAGIYIFRGLGYVMAHMSHILQKREKVQTNRKISDRELFKLVMRRPPFSYYYNRFVRYISKGIHG